MAYTVFKYTDADSNDIDFIADPTPSGYIALQSVQFEPQSSSADRPRAEANASYPTFTYYKKLLTHLSGDILAGSSSEFNVFKAAMLEILMIAADTQQTDRNQGTLTIRPHGISHNWTIPASVESITIPEVALYASRSEYTLTFKHYRPYFYEAFSDTYKWWF